MGKINIANLKRTLYYLKRNGLKNTWYAARERLSDGQAAPYVYVGPSEEELESQRALVREHAEAQEEAYEGITFSIVVPTYRTNQKQLEEMITSVIKQSYPHWELILADATEDDGVKNCVAELLEKRPAEQRQISSEKIRYIRLPENGGISENTNQALRHVSGEYVGLLDHDDLLAPDALFEMAECVRKARMDGVELQVLYSDEDKCNGDATEYFEPHYKECFNLDLILSNNYMCHFMVMRAGLIQKLGLRKEFDGAQDYDLVLRAVSELHLLEQVENESLVCHVPKVLYHWRCHAASTAENPRSKDYAYEAGLRALQDFARRSGLHAEACHLKHLGFYKLCYLDGTPDMASGIAGAGCGIAEGMLRAAANMLRERPDIGVIGGCLVRHGKIVGGRMDGTGRALYRGLSIHHSGYMHRAVLPQDAEAVDIRAVILRRELWDLFEEVVGVPYGLGDTLELPEGADYVELSLRLCRAVHEKGYRIAYLPEIKMGNKNG